MIEDLSTHHHPVGNLFAWPTRAAEWDRYHLTEEQIEFYNSNGYLAGIRILSDAQVEQLRDELAEPLIPPTGSAIVVSDSDEPPLDGVPPVPRGEKMQGQFFPLLFAP